MLDTPARVEDVRAILEEVDDETVLRVVETGASIDEISEAMHLLDNHPVDEVPSTAHVEEVREILAGERSRIATA